ncbi:MAG: hypothetical protein Q9227_008187 [Pyrenula ochraceoflavens]
MGSTIVYDYVPSFSELEQLPHIQEEALRDDGLHKYSMIANPQPDYMVGLLRSGLERNFAEGPDHIKFIRAIERRSDGSEKVVGFSCWYFGEGYTRPTGSKEAEGVKADDDKQDAMKSEGNVSVAVAPPALAAVDPAEMAERAQELLDNQPIQSEAEKAENERQRRRAKRAEGFLSSVFGPYGQYYDQLVRGKPHIYLRQMYVLPSHQGRGIASKLMQWGVQKADENGWLGFTIATQRGHPMYLKYGFYDEIVAKFDLPDMDSDDDTKVLDTPYYNYVMLRKPANKV